MENLSLTCDACGGTFKSKSDLDLHMEREHGGQPTKTTTAGRPEKERSE